MKHAFDLSLGLAQYVDDMMDAGKIQAYPVSEHLEYFVTYKVILVTVKHYSILQTLAY